jgi:hypothetical protein
MSWDFCEGLAQTIYLGFVLASLEGFHSTSGPERIKI